MLSQIHGAQNDLDQLLAQLGSAASSLLAEGLAKRELLAKLERTLTSGAPIPIASVKGEVAGVVAGTAALAQQARAANDQSSSSALATAQARTRASVEEMSRDIYQRRIFDPYLHFASAEDEATCRRREEQNRRAIDDALAEHTPQGDLRAARIMGRQLKDAGDHGADASPQFGALANRNARDIERLESALGQEPARGDERRDAQDGRTEPPAPATSDQLASVLATFRAAGIAGGLPARDSGHGLSIDGSAPDQSRTV